MYINLSYEDSTYSVAFNICGHVRFLVLYFFNVRAMTPQEKAKELFDKYCFAIRTEEEIDAYWTNVIHAKECALIAVNEIQEAVMFLDDDSEDYWFEVKQEIEKL